MFEGMNQQNSEWRDILIDADNNSISFKNIEVTIPQNSEEGTWVLDRIYGRDVVGNNLYIERDSDGNYVCERIEFYRDSEGNYVCLLYTSDAADELLWV